MAVLAGTLADCVDVSLRFRAAVTEKLFGFRWVSHFVSSALQNLINEGRDEIVLMHPVADQVDWSNQPGPQLDQGASL